MDTGEKNMSTKQDYSHLRFDQRLPRMHPRLLAMLIAIGIYLLIWWILPPISLLVLLFFIVPLLVWTASYGWRRALEQLIRYLERLQMF